MKVIQAVGWFYPDSWGGTEIYVAGVASRLVAAGHQVIVVAPHAGGAAERSYVHDGIPVYRYPIPAAPGRAEAQGAGMARGAERLHRFLAAQQPDVVHMHTFVTGLGLFEAAAAREAGARVIATTHSASLGFLCARGTMMRWGREVCDDASDDEACAGCMLESRGLPRPVASAVVRFPTPSSSAFELLPRSCGAPFRAVDFVRDQRRRQATLFDVVDRFVVLTGWAHDALVRHGAPPAKVAVNRLGIGQPAADYDGVARRRRTNRPVRFGYVGRLDPLKGTLDFVRALRSLPESLPFRAEVRGPVFGAAERSHLEALRRAVADDERIVIADAVANQDVLNALAAIDVLCCPSLTPEGGPTVALEAHAVGTPVIGTGIGGLRELVTDRVNGRLVAPGDWKALADICREIVECPQLVDRWRDALPSVRTLDDVTREYLAMYVEPAVV